MKKKRFVKLLMGAGYSRNRANVVAGLIPYATLEVFGNPTPLTFARSWDAVRALERLKQLTAKEVDAAET